MSSPIIEISNLVKCYESSQEKGSVLAGLNLSVNDHEVLAVLGRSGCGKTTLLRIIAGFESATQGTVMTRQHPSIAMVFQDPRLLPWKTVRENIVLALLHGQQPLDKQSAVDEALALVRLHGCANLYPDELSGGMAQRVGLARALVMRPDILLLDEPFGALDALTRRMMQREFVQILSEHPMTVLLVTHDVSEAVALADRIVELRDGIVAKEWQVPLARPRKVGAVELADLEETILNQLLDE